MTDDTPLVYVVDDDSAMRDSISFLVSSVGYVCQTYVSAETFLETFKAGSPACLVVDVRMSSMSGLELQRRLVAQGATLGVVFVTGHGDVPMAVTAMRGGAVDFLEKPFNDQRLLDCINEALRFSRQATAEAICRAAICARLDRLTAREREVLNLVVAG